MALDGLFKIRVTTFRYEKRQLPRDRIILDWAKMYHNRRLDADSGSLKQSQTHTMAYRAPLPESK